MKTVATRRWVHTCGMRATMLTRTWRGSAAGRPGIGDLPCLFPEGFDEREVRASILTNLQTSRVIQLIITTGHPAVIIDGETMRRHATHCRCTTPGARDTYTLTKLGVQIRDRHEVTFIRCFTQEEGRFQARTFMHMLGMLGCSLAHRRRCRAISRQATSRLARS